MKSYNFSQMEKKYHFYVHRLVAHDFLENPDNKQLVDHIDGNRQNNQVTNLRYATISENNRNRLKSIKSTTSRYKGVYWSKENSKWRARIEVNGKKIHLGYFDNEPVEVVQIQNKKSVKDTAIDFINKCTTYDELKTWEIMAKNNSELSKIYDEKVIELSK